MNFGLYAAEDGTEGHTMQHEDPQEGGRGEVIVTMAILTLKYSLVSHTVQLKCVVIQYTEKYIST